MSAKGNNFFFLIFFHPHHSIIYTSPHIHVEERKEGGGLCGGECLLYSSKPPSAYGNTNDHGETQTIVARMKRHKASKEPW